MPSWIFQSAINYTNLCWQFQILQTVPNIFLYDTSCKEERFGSLKFWLHRVPLKMTLWENKVTKIVHILGYFPWKFLFFLRNHLYSLENLQKFDHIIAGIEYNSYICGGGGGTFWRPSWMPSWISQLAISYANLCRQFQKLRTMPSILVYDTSCSTWARGGGWGGESGGVLVTPRNGGLF